MRKERLKKMSLAYGFLSVVCFATALTVGHLNGSHLDVMWLSASCMMLMMSHTLNLRSKKE